MSDVCPLWGWVFNLALIHFLSLLIHFIFTTVFSLWFIAAFSQLYSSSSLIVICWSLIFTVCHNANLVVLKFWWRIIWMRGLQFLLLTIEIWLFTEDITLYLLYFFSLTLDNSLCHHDSVTEVGIFNCIVTAQ